MKCHLEKLAVKNMKRLRKERKWSQFDLAEKSDLTFTWISDVERGVGTFNLLMLQNVCRAFEVMPSDLLEENNV